MIFSTFLAAVIQIFSMLLNAYIWIIIVGSFVLLIQPTFNHPIMQIFHRLTSPVYKKIRQYIPTIYGNIDFAPLFLVIGLKFIDLFFIKLALQYL